MTLRTDDPAPERLTEAQVVAQLGNKPKLYKKESDGHFYKLGG